MSYAFLVLGTQPSSITILFQANPNMQNPRRRCSMATTSNNIFVNKKKKQRSEPSALVRQSELDSSIFSTSNPSLIRSRNQISRLADYLTVAILFLFSSVATSLARSLVDFSFFCFSSCFSLFFFQFQFQFFSIHTMSRSNT